MFIDGWVHYDLDQEKYHLLREAFSDDLPLTELHPDPLDGMLFMHRVAADTV